MKRFLVDIRFRPIDYVCSVDTVEEGRQIIREFYPHAVFARGWDVNGSRCPQRWPRDRKHSAWYFAKLRVFAHSQAAELDVDGERVAATITNRLEDPPEAGARLFEGDRELISCV